MKKRLPFIKLFFVLFFSTAIIFSTSYFGVNLYENMKRDHAQSPNKTFIGGVNIAGKSKEEAASLLQTTYTDWATHTTFILKYGDKNAVFPLNQLQFNAKKNIQLANVGMKNKIVVFLDSRQVGDQLRQSFPQLSINDIDIKRLVSNMEEKASILQKGNYHFDLFNDYLQNGADKPVIISKVVLSTTNDLSNFFKRRYTIEVPKHSNFSFSTFIKKNGLNQMSTESLSLLASGFYKAILSTNFQVIERNIGRSIPEYNMVGFEAKYDPNQTLDFIFKNPNNSSYDFDLQVENTHLEITLKGKKLPYQYQINTIKKQYFQPKTVIQYSPVLPFGQIKLTNKGSDGISVKVYRDVLENGQRLRSELVADDYYAPDSRVEIHSTALSSLNQTNGNTAQSNSLNPTSGQSNETVALNDFVGAFFQGFFSNLRKATNEQK